MYEQTFRKLKAVCLVHRKHISKWYERFDGTMRVACNGSITLLGTDSDSTPIPVVGSWDWNQNLTPCRVNIST